MPEGTNLPFQLTINTQGRIESAEKFGKIIVKTGEQGQNVYLKDVVRETKYAPNGRCWRKAWNWAPRTTTSTATSTASRP